MKLLIIGPCGNEETDRFTGNHRHMDQDTEANILETGIKVIDLFLFIKEEKLELLEVLVSENSSNVELINNIAKAHGGYSVFASRRVLGR